MRNGSNEGTTVDSLVSKLPAARAFLRAARIDSSSMTLREAALASSTSPDELLAQLEARLRRQSRRVEVTREERVHA